jgi:hypothetical protein
MIGDRSADHWEVSREASREILWSAFALRLQWELQEAALHTTAVAPLLSLGKPAWLAANYAPRVGIVATAQSLSQFLYLNLGCRMREQRVLLRLCKGCPIIFPVPVTNRKRRYHDPACKNRSAFQKWYSRPKNRRAHNARRSHTLRRTATRG